MEQDWVSRFAEEERQRDDARQDKAAAAALRADVARSHLHSLLDALMEQVATDVEAFAREFPERAITFEKRPFGGFIVRRAHFPEVRLTVAPNVEAGTIFVEYISTSGSGTSIPQPRELVVGGHQADALHFKDEDGQQAFRKVEQLSEYLLAPVFAGRTR